MIGLTGKYENSALSEAQAYVKILDQRRFEGNELYHTAEVLRSIHPSLLDIWQDRSNVNDYTKRHIHLTFKNQRWTIRSLAYLASSDNPKEYSKIRGFYYKPISLC